MIQLSLNEYSALVKRAARGALIEWGYAEDFAKIAVWLNQYATQLLGITNHQINDYILQFLIAHQNQPEQFDAPCTASLQQSTITPRSNSYPNLYLNPLVISSLIRDLDWHNHNIQSQINNIAYSLILLPCCYQYIDKAQYYLLLAEQVDTIQLVKKSVVPIELSVSDNRISLSNEALRQFEKLMLNICVPETEASLSDAG